MNAREWLVWPAALVVGTFVFGVWVSYIGGGKDGSGVDAPLVRGLGLIVWWLITYELAWREVRARRYRPPGQDVP